jgi:carboxyl-terminal processing protease
MRPSVVAVFLGALSVAVSSLAEQPATKPNAPVRISLNPLKPLAAPRTLVSESKTRLPNGTLAVQQLWRWKDPRRLKAGQRMHQLGRLKVARNYKPVQDGTIVEQLVLYTKARRRTVTPEVATAAATLQQVMSLAKNRYVEPVDEAKVLRDAARGVAAGLDRHTNFFDPQQFERLQIHLRGHTVGVGVSIRERKGQEGLTIDRTFPGPARHAGVRKGDRLLSVNGTEVTSVVQAAKLLGGKEGSSVKVRLERAGKPLELTIQRQSVDFNPVRSRLTRDGIGYIRLAQFDDGAAGKVQGALARLERRNRGGLKGLVLDLRGNPGGSLKEATTLLNTFVGQGTLVTTRRRGGVVGQVFEADPGKVTHAKLPLTVLIDGDSASASELVSGSLRDHGRATLIGKKSFGKGTVQTVLPLADGSGIKMTMARYHLPGGKTPDKDGVMPDISWEQARERYRSSHRAREGRRIVDYAYEEALSVLRKPGPVPGSVASVPAVR